MGSLRRHSVGELQKRYHLFYFVETGLWRGDGLLHALKHPFTRCFSIEINPAFVAEAERRISYERGISQAHRWQLLLGDSAEMVPALIGTNELNGPTLWWLDAHYPERYEAGQGTWLPLVAEVRAIVESPRPHEGDVLIVDDTRIYGAQAAEGPLPARPGLAPGDPAQLREIWELLAPTHTLTLDRRDAGYLIALPHGEA